MIENFGLGIDIVNTDKFEKMPYSKKPTFYKKLFLPSEIKYYLRFKKSGEHFAGKFAIKESLKKSIIEPISFLDIETYHSNSKLKIKLLKGWSKKYKVSGSISHDKKYAIGMLSLKKSICNYYYFISIIN